MLALVDAHCENAFCAEKFTDQASCFIGMIFSQVWIAAEIFENFAECDVADGVGDEVDVFAVAAKCAVQKLEGALVNADACDGGILLGAICDGIANDVFVFVNDSFFNAFETGESAVGFECIPEDAFECVARIYCRKRIWVWAFHIVRHFVSIVAFPYNVFLCGCQVFFNAPVGALLVQSFVNRENDCKKCRIEYVRQT